MNDNYNEALAMQKENQSTQEKARDEQTKAALIHLLWDGRVKLQLLGENVEPVEDVVSTAEKLFAFIKKNEGNPD